MRYFVDSNAGLDANPGTDSAPKRTLAFRWDHGDEIALMRGGLYPVIEKWKDTRNGQRMFAYGAAGPNPVLRNPSGIGGMIFNCSSQEGRAGAVWEDIDFDCSVEPGMPLLSGAIYMASQGAGIQRDHVLRRVRFRRSGGCGFQMSIEATSTGTLRNVLLEDVECADNDAHGALLMGTGHVVRRGKFHGNGISANTPSGGHGLSAICALADATGWTATAGTIYAASIPSNRTNIIGLRVYGDPTHSFLRRAYYNPDKPALGEYGVAAGALYINIGGSPGKRQVSYAWGRTGDLLIEDCQTWGNVLNPATIYAEGTGIQLDGWTEDSTMQRCSSVGDGGPGFAINGGARNQLRGVSAVGAGQMGVSITGPDNWIDRATLVANCGNGSDADIVFRQGTGRVTDSILVGSRVYGVAGGAGVTVERTMMRGQGARVQAGVVETGALQ